MEFEKGPEPDAEEEVPVPICTQNAVYCARCFHTFGLTSNDADEDSASTTSTTDEDSASPLQDEDPENIEEQILEEIDDYVHTYPLRMSKPTVERDIINEVSGILHEEWLDLELCEEDDLSEIREWVGYMTNTYFDTQVPRRQGGQAAELTPLRRAKLANKLRLLDSTVTPPQRTQEWYEMRYNMITASNLYKALGSESQQNQLIVEKCQAFDQFKADCARHGNLSSDNPMAHGTKYEAISAMIYEKRNRTRLGEYGCMVHPEWSFVGASPDGINVDPEAATYGRMVEIKNIVNRQIDGIPLEHYWVQMQVQMEVCDLDECDFVETRIKEFANREAYLESDNAWKGVVLTFTQRIAIGAFAKEKLPDFYEHWVSTDAETADEWIQAKKTEHREKYVLLKTDYWGLDQYSCVLVLRNRMWFDAAIGKVESVWKIIEAERITGCEHRAPKKRAPKKEPAATTLTVVKLEDGNPNQNCTGSESFYDTITSPSSLTPSKNPEQNSMQHIQQQPLQDIIQ